MALPPHVSREELMSTLKEELPSLPNVPSTDPEAFLQSVVLWLIGWRTQHKAKDLTASPPVAFFLEREGKARMHGWKLAPLFREARSVDIVNKACLFLTTMSMHQVYRTQVNKPDVEGLYTAAVKFGLDKQPCLVYLPNQEAVIWCPTGVAGSVKKRFSMLFNQIETIDQAAIDKALEEFHKEHTSFPDGWANIWYSASGGIVEKKTENSVRNWLCNYLKFRIFKSSHVAREYQLSSGRADIWIGSIMPSSTPSTYILELKIFRSRHFPGITTTPRSVSKNATLRYARSGIRQAKRYKTSDGAKLAYLCCFDARDENEYLNDVATEAETNEILYRQYYCDRSSKAA